MLGTHFEGVRIAGSFPSAQLRVPNNSIQMLLIPKRKQGRGIRQQCCHFCVIPNPKQGQDQQESTQNIGRTELPLETELFYHQL